MVEMITSHCKFCSKEYENKSWEITTGLLKGHKMVDSAFCSSMCEGNFQNVRRTMNG